MKKPTIILELLAEGGSLTLYRTQKGFIYSTNEVALMDLLEELKEEDVLKTSDLFLSFHDAMMSMLSKYKIFNLYPGQIHPDFLEIIKEQYQNFKIIYGFESAWNEDKWHRILYGQTEQNWKKNNTAIWQSSAVNELERSYAYMRYTGDRINFLIDEFLDYREYHSFGEYDETVALSDDELLEREERMEFLTYKFKEVKKEIFTK